MKYTGWLARKRNVNKDHAYVLVIAVKSFMCKIINIPRYANYSNEMTATFSLVDGNSKPQLGRFCKVKYHPTLTC